MMSGNELLTLIEHGLVDKDDIINNFVKFLSNDEINEFCTLNEICPRIELLARIEIGLVDKDHIINSFVKFLSNDEINEFCTLNEILPIKDYVDEEKDDEYEYYD